MAQNRISVLVSLDAADDNLKATLARAEKSLNDFSASARSAGEKASTSFAEVKAGMNAFGDQVAKAKTQLLAFLTINWASGKVQEIVQIADAWNMMSARLKLATAGNHEYMVAQKELFAIAQRIGVPLQETATLYGKLQQAVRMLGGEQQDALQITESISQALRLSGASASEAQSALLQFGQALSSGVLRGEEFNSVVENSPRLAKALADGLNVPIGRLRKLAEEGRLTADVVVNALISQRDKLAAEYAQLPQTVSQAFERLKNAFGLWVHQLDESTGFTRKLAAALDYLTEHLATVMKWLNLIKDVGLAVIIYRLLPALATAWQTAGAAGVMAANATAAAWTTANLSVGAAIATAGKLRVAFGVLGAFLAGWEIGTWLSEKFEIVRKAGIFLVEVLMKGIEQLRFQWEVFAAVFTADTLAEATKRHEARLAQMKQIFGEMYAEASKGADAAKGVMNTAATAAEEIARRLEAVRQGTQEAVGRGIETVHAALEKLKGRLGEVEQATAKANQTVNEATAKMAEAYKGLTAIVEASLARQMQAVKTRYEQEKSALELSRQSQAAQIVQATQLLTEALTRQTTLRRQATTETLGLIDQETQARKDAAARQGQTEEERRANVTRVENDILAAKRQTLTQSLSEYRSHIDALNAEANRHLAEIKRIEDEKRALQQSTEERIRELNRSTMTDYEAYQDKQTQIAELQQKARVALVQGEFEQAKQYAKQAADLASQTAHMVKQGDQEVVSQKQAVKTAIDAIRSSEELTIQALNGEGRAHTQAAEAATGARRQIEQVLRQTQSQIDDIGTQLKDRFQLTLSADTSRLDQALVALDRAIAEKERLLPIKADLEQAEKQLAQLETQLKEGKTVLIDADIAKAESALAKLAQYAKDNAEVELRVATDKALSSVQNVQRQIAALSDIETRSRHQVQTNAATARSEIMSLDGMNTASTHTITVRRVEANAAGGVVGGGLRAIAGFARGGQVGYPRMDSGRVPGTGDGDTVPRALQAGSFVLRRAAVQKYGEALVSKFAFGGLALPRIAGAGGGRTGTAAKTENPLVRKVLEMINLGQMGLGAGYDELSRKGVPVSAGAKEKVLRDAQAQANEDAGFVSSLLGLEVLTSAEQARLERIKTRWKNAMMSAPHDMERDLIAATGSGYAHGGNVLASSDTVPAMLTPGEYVIKRETVQRLGVGFFDAINRMKAPVAEMARRVRGYASGGLVQSAQHFAGGGAVAAFTPTRLPLPRESATEPSQIIRLQFTAPGGQKSASATVNSRADAQAIIAILREAGATAA